MRIYNSHIKKLDFKIVDSLFIDYTINFKRFKFYYPSHTPGVNKARNVKFLEDLELSERDFSQINFKKIKII